MNHPKHPFGGPLSLAALIPLLSPQEASFFTALDAELDKIESFYLDREKEMVALSRRLEEQLAELSDHRRRFYVRSPLREYHLVFTMVSSVYRLQTPTKRDTAYGPRRSRRQSMRN